MTVTRIACIYSTQLQYCRLYWQYLLFFGSAPCAQMTKSASKKGNPSSLRHDSVKTEWIISGTHTAGSCVCTQGALSASETWFFIVQFSKIQPDIIYTVWFRYLYVKNKVLHHAFASNKQVWVLKLLLIRNNRFLLSVLHWTLTQRQSCTMMWKLETGGKRGNQKPKVTC